MGKPITHAETPRTDGYESVAMRLARSLKSSVPDVEWAIVLSMPQGALP
jgi:hypothetical protein